MDSQPEDLHTSSAKEGDLWNDIDLIKYWDTALSGYKARFIYIISITTISNAKIVDLMKQQYHSKDNTTKLGEMCPDPLDIPRSNIMKRQVPTDALVEEVKAKKPKIAESMETMDLPNDNQEMLKEKGEEQGQQEEAEEENYENEEEEEEEEEKEEEKVEELEDEVEEEEEEPEDYEENPEEEEEAGEQEERADDYQDQGHAYYNHHYQEYPQPSVPYYSEHSYYTPKSTAHAPHAMPTIPPMPPMPPMPQRANSSAQDDEMLSNLMMAWYYSGYYTGLYQARRS
ncbi:hypothetical protein CLU79DRAFT_743790 [Phycomyces nitens]|nr:hypothetical protein CLU79DRAFT_743790 [Phycomyces nitens]